VQWEPFFLATDIPKEGMDMMDYFAAKYGAANLSQIAKRTEYLHEAGRNVGIAFSKARRVVPTLNAHRLMEWCNSRQPLQKSDELMENLFKKYFEEAKDISSHDVLVEAAREAGLDVAQVTAFLTSDELGSAVLGKDMQVKKEMRVSGVPFFVITKSGGGKPLTFSGAQVY